LRISAWVVAAIVAIYPWDLHRPPDDFAKRELELHIGDQARRLGAPALLVDTADYTVSLATHDFENDITDAGIVATATVSISGVTGGALTASNTTFSTVTGDVSESLVLWVDTGGADTTDPLIAYFDTFSAGMPVTPNGGDITIAWASGTILTIKANDA